VLWGRVGIAVVHLDVAVKLAFEPFGELLHLIARRTNPQQPDQGAKDLLRQGGGLVGRVSASVFQRGRRGAAPSLSVLHQRGRTAFAPGEKRSLPIAVGFGRCHRSH